MEMGINKYSAYDVVNNLDKKELENIIKILGEEKDGKLIANKIIKARVEKKIKTPKDLVDIINKAKKKYKNYKRNPATKTFQAIRIYVNRELTELINGLIEATKLLPRDGILLVISFHSLEDKIVKYFFNFYSNLKSNPSRYLPSDNKNKALFKVLSKKSKIPEISEIESNFRSRSAKLRYAVRNDTLFFYPKNLEKKFNNYLRAENIKV